MEHLIVNNLLDYNQHGFVPKKSCMTQHIEVLDEWTKCIDTGRCVDVAFMNEMIASAADGQTGLF